MARPRPQAAISPSQIGGLNPLRRLIAVLLFALITSAGATSLAATPGQPRASRLSADLQPGRHYNVAATHSPRLERMLAGARADSPATSNPPAPGTVPGIDVASGQHVGGATINWAQVAAAGYRFAFIKATEGSYYANPFFASDLAGATSAGLLVAAYHFANPSFSGGALQADFAVDHAGTGGDGLTLPVIADLEFDPYAAQDHTNECYGLTRPQMVSWIRSFSAEVRRRTGQLPVIYTVASWWDNCTGGSSAFAADPLWVASFSPGAGGPAMPAGWPGWAYWQYTSAGSVPGIHGVTDLSELSPAALEVAAPGSQTDPAGTSVSVPVRSVNAAAGQALSYSATGLPAGLAIDPAAGVIAGTLPAAPGSTSVTVTVSGTGLTPSSQTFSWNVAGPVRLARIAGQSGRVGGPQFLQAGASDGLAGCTLRFTATGLPPGLAIGPCGLISGWLTRPGSYHPAISVRDTTGAALAGTSFTWQVGKAPATGPAGHVREYRRDSCLVREGGTARIAPCAQVASQRWTITQDGTLRQGHGCLATGDSQVRMRSCAGTIFQQWRQATGGALISLQAGDCLAFPASRTAPASAAACDGGPGQQWVLPAGQLAAGLPGWCASAWHPAHSPAGPVSLRSCGDGRATAWTAWPDGTLRGAGRCLAVTGAANSPVRMAPCTGAAGEQWQIAGGQVGAQLVSPSRGLCLDVPHDQRATVAHLVLGYCAAADPGTSWRLG